MILNKNHKNPLLRKILSSEYLTISVLILLVSKLPASLITDTVNPFRAAFSSRKNHKNSYSFISYNCNKFSGNIGFLAKRVFSFCGLVNTSVIVISGLAMAVKLALKDIVKTLGTNAQKSIKTSEGVFSVFVSKPCALAKSFC